MSISVTVRNGTAVGQESLCRTCRHAHIQMGYSESEEVVRCGYFRWNTRMVPFAVRDCSNYLSKLLPTLDEMEEMAFSIDLKKGNPRAGFGGATAVALKSEEDSE
jgi:hypothetical protein